MPVAAKEIVWTVVVAGGSGARFGLAKQYERIGGERMIDRSSAVAAAAGDGVVVVVPSSDVDRERSLIPIATVVAGGSTRSESVRAGLDAVPDGATIVCVHDAARPFASAALYSAVIDAVVDGADGAIPGLPVTDTIKIVDGKLAGGASAVVSTPDRATLVAVQTPQAFRAGVLRRAHARRGDATDDAAMVEAAGGRVVVVGGELDNRKITHPEDLAWAIAKVASSEVAS